MKISCFVAFLFLLFSCGVSEPIQESTRFKAVDTAESKMYKQIYQAGNSFFKVEKDSNRKELFHTLNTRFFVHTAMMSDIPFLLLIKEKMERKSGVEDTRCSNGRLELTIYRFLEDSLSLLRQIKAPALSYAFTGQSGRFFVTDIEGCGNAFPLHGLYSLRRPDPMLFFYKRYNTLTLPVSGEKRYVAFHPYLGAIKPVDKKDGQQLVGVLRYTDEMGHSSDLALRCSDSVLLQNLRKNPPMLFFTVMRNDQLVRAADMELYPERGAKPILIPDGFNIEINFSRTANIEAIVVPVKMNRIDRKAIQIVDDRLQLEQLH